MTHSIELDTHIRYTDDEGIHLLFAGDRVACCANGREYFGRITGIGLHQESNETQPYKAVCIDISSENEKNMPRQLIKVDEITGITKYGLDDETGYSLNELFFIINGNWNRYPEEDKKRLLNILSCKK